MQFYSLKFMVFTSYHVFSVIKKILFTQKQDNFSNVSLILEIYNLNRIKNIIKENLNTCYDIIDKVQFIK